MDRGNTSHTRSSKRSCSRRASRPASRRPFSKSKSSSPRRKTSSISSPRNNRPDPDVEFNKLRKGGTESDEETTVNNTSTPAALESVETKPVTAKKSAAKKKAASTTKARAIGNKAKAAAALNDTSSPKRKRKILNDTTGDVSSLDLDTFSPASNLKFGFLGLGMVKNLLNSGHSVVVWNRTATKCRKFQEVDAEVADTPSDVIEMADVTFSCVADPQVAKELVFGNCGVLSANLVGKGYVEMTGVDPETSHDIAEQIISKGGRYLEAQIQGSKNQAEEGTLIILAAGERVLFEECQISWMSWKCWN
ncbi:AAEL017189-PA [Aedes aegypti]|uniref:AAEL017189-PA n=1 Tax=Aedes aegypti TaxID=7159 RepID=J9HTR5_AEDAE|nr:AAEL017189-PA [Aedes aegypti]